MLVRIVLCISAFLFVAGCGLAEIKNERASTVELSKAVFFKVVDNVNIGSATLSAEGRAINPRYEYSWFGGVGPYSHGYIQAVGVEIGARTAAAGNGGATPDADMRAKLFEIMNRRDINEQERKNAINTTLLEWISATKRKTNDSPAASQPASEQEPDTVHE